MWLAVRTSDLDPTTRRLVPLSYGILSSGIAVQRSYWISRSRITNESRLRSLAAASEKPAQDERSRAASGGCFDESGAWEQSKWGRFGTLER